MVEAAWGTLGELREEGKIRWAGVSNFGLDLLERCARIRPLDAAQLPLSLLEDKIVEAELPWLAERGVATLVYSPLESGLLSGSFSLERLAALPEDDWRRRRPRFQSPEVERALHLVERLRPLAAELGTSVAELAIAWTTHFDGVAGAIVGARTPAQVDGWIGAAQLELGSDVLVRMADATRRREHSMTWRRIQERAAAQPAVTAIALYAVVAIGAFLAAYFSIFSEFAPYDDEGTLLVTLKAFVHGDALYSEIWSVYGPFYYELFGGFFKLFGLSVTTDASRTIVLFVWVGTSLLFGVAAQRLTGRLSLGLTAMIAAFSALAVLANEPMHPQGLCVLLLAAFAFFAVGGLTRPGRLERASSAACCWRRWC